MRSLGDFANWRLFLHILVILLARSKLTFAATLSLINTHLILNDDADGHSLDGAIEGSGFRDIFTFSETSRNGHFWHLTDIHLDRNYSLNGNPEKMCHPYPNSENTSTSTGNYGNFRCDSPWTLVDSTIKAMKKIAPQPDFIIWTGDSVSHPIDLNSEATWDEVYQIHLNISRRLRSAFPSQKILPVLGNHDESPPNILPPGKSQIYRDYLEKGGWNVLLPRSAWKTFISGGYYNVYVRPRLQVIGLNTLLWTKRNKMLMDLEDPANQFEWLERVLNNAESNGDKVYLIGHMPPGFYTRARVDKRNTLEFYEKFNQRFIEIIVRYQDVIAGQMFGHQHTDTFLLIRDENGKPVSTILLAPSVTPWYEPAPKYPDFYVPVNPAVRLFTYDKASATLLNYQQYFLNLTKANQDAKPGEDAEWELLYSFGTAYGLTDITPTSMQILYGKLSTEKDMFLKYYNYTTAAKYSRCDAFCKKAHLCSISHVTQNEYYACIESSGSSNTNLWDLDGDKEK